MMKSLAVFVFAAVVEGLALPQGADPPADGKSEPEASVSAESGSKPIVRCAGITEATGPQADALYAELLDWLEEYRDLIKHAAGECSDSAWTAQATMRFVTEDPSGTFLDNDGTNPFDLCAVDQALCNVCALDEADVAQMTGFLDKLVTSHRDEARKCFDPFMSHLPVVDPIEPDPKFAGYTPSTSWKKSNKIVKWLDRPVFKNIAREYDFQPVPGAIADDLAVWGQKLFEPELEDAGPVKIGSAVFDLSIRNFPNVWLAAPWVPFYMSNDNAGSFNFRASYAYTELVGPWGMLKIDEIDGTEFRKEIGLTIQRAGTYYPGHYHIAKELYFSLVQTPNFQCRCPEGFDKQLPCDGHVEVALFDPEDKTAASQPEWTPRFKPMAPEQPDLYSIHILSRHIHAFQVNNCGRKPPGMITAWARTTVDFLTGTNFCEYPPGADLDTFSKKEAMDCSEALNLVGGPGGALP